jgi:hypothetical protein
MFIILNIRNNPTERNKQIVKLSIPRIFIAIIYLIYELNAHKLLDIHYYLSHISCIDLFNLSILMHNSFIY